MASAIVLVNVGMEENMLIVPKFLWRIKKTSSLKFQKNIPNLMNFSNRPCLKNRYHPNGSNESYDMIHILPSSTCTSSYSLSPEAMPEAMLTQPVAEKYLNIL